MSFIRARSASASVVPASRPAPPMRAQSDSDVLRSVGEGYVIVHTPEPHEAQHNSAVQQEIDAATRQLELLESWLADHGMLHLKMDVTEAFIQADYPASDWVQTLREMEEHGELAVFVEACALKQEQRALSEVASKMPAELWRLVLSHSALGGADHLAASSVCRVWRQVVLTHTPVQVCLRHSDTGGRALAWACHNLGDWSLRLKIPQLLLSEPMSRGLAAACAGGSLRQIDVRAPLSAATGNKLLRLVEQAESSRLVSLEMAGSFLGTPGGHGLAACLRTNRAVVTYGFASNFVGPEAGASIAASLGQAQCAVTSLDLRRNGLSTAAQALGAALADNVSLKTLLLGENELGPEGGVALAKGLQTNVMLTCLDLSRNSLGDDGAVAVADALRTNPSGSALRSLDLQSNGLGTPAAQAWAAALSSSSKGAATDTTGRLALRTLNLEGNPRLLQLLPADHRSRSALDGSDTTAGDGSTLSQPPAGGTAAALACEMAVQELISAMEMTGGNLVGITVAGETEELGLGLEIAEGIPPTDGGC
jgi:hypothetical protein